MTPRNIWLQNRILEFSNSISSINPSDWSTYIDSVREHAEEILYCVTEWEKYYKETKLG